MDDSKKTFEQMIAEMKADPLRRHAADADIFRHKLSVAMMDLIETARVEKGLSKADLARAAGLNPASVRKILTSPSANPRLSTLIEFANALDCELVLVPRVSDREFVANTNQ